MECTDQDTGKLIASYELGLLSDEERRRFENHLLDCEHCFRSLYRTAPLANLMREGRVAPAARIEPSTAEARETDHGEPSRISRPPHFIQKTWAYVAAGAVAATVLALVGVRLLGPWGQTEQLRGQDDVSILVLAPVGEVTAPSELRWKPVAGVVSYEAGIHTATGDLVWKSSATKPHAELPAPIRSALRPGHTYYWQVEAVTAEGDRLKSEVIGFTVRR